MDIERAFIVIPLVGYGGLIQLAYDQFLMATLMWSLSDAFFQIRLATFEVVNSHEVCNADEANKSFRFTEMVDPMKLFKLLRWTRKQTKTLNHIIGPSQLFCLGLAFVITVVNWIMVIELTRGGISMYMVLLSVTTGGFMFVRFVTFDMISSRILEEEKLIVDIIRNMNFYRQKHIEMEVYRHKNSFSACNYTV